MRPSVRDAFVGFTKQFEGYCTWMYLDQRGLVTTGIGNLIDGGAGADGPGQEPPQPWVNQPALSLPWKKADGTLASSDEIAAEWENIKGHWAQDGNGGGWFQSIATLHLDDDAISNLVWSKAQANEDTLKGRYPNYDNWPADAQMGVLSMAWAMGAGFHFPAFDDAANGDPPDFATAATQSQMRPTPGIAPRNAADLLLFQNAAKVVSASGDPDKLWYPDTTPDNPAPATLAQGGTTAVAKASSLALLLILAGGSWALVHFWLGPRIAQATKHLADRHAERVALEHAMGGAPAA